MQKTIKWCFLFLLFFTLGQTVVQKSDWTEQKNILQKVLPKEAQNQWYQIEGNYSRVYYQTEKEIAQMIQRQADTYYSMIAKDFDWKRTEKIDFMLFETKQMFMSSFFYEGEIPMGVYYKGVIGIVSPNLWDVQKQGGQKTDYFLEKGPVVHEMIHFAVEEKTKGNCPRFLTEGIALYYEKKYTGFLWYIAEEEKQKQITKAKLEKEFDQIDVSLSYWKSYEWVAKFVECYGEETLQKALQQKGEKEI